MSKRIALYLPSLTGGGAEQVMVTLANGFAERELSVDLVLVKASGRYLKDVAPAVRIVDLASRRVLFSLPALVRYLRRERPHAMLSALHHANVVAVWARWLARTSTALVVSEHTTVTASSGYKRKGQPWLMRRAYPHAHAVVAVSKGVADDLVSALGLPPEHVQVIYNPIVTDELLRLSRVPVRHPWCAPGAPPVILAAGRLTEEKDFSTLVQAYSLLRERRPGRLVILGEGEKRGELEALITRLGLEADVYLPGFLDNPFTWMREARLFVLSSRREGLPSVLIQAMACGTQVVSTDCPSGPAEILENGRWGRLVPVGDAEALAAAIHAALDDEESERPQVEVRASAFGVAPAVDDYLKVLGLEGLNRSLVWMADWSDAEDGEFRAACEAAGVAVEVVRSAPLGTTVGRAIHRLRSYPRYVSLALRGTARAAGGSLVAWQPLAGVVAGCFPRWGKRRLIVLNPNLRKYGGGLRQALKLAGASRADRVVFYSRAALESAAALGLPRERLRVVPLGVRPRRSHPAPPGAYLLAVGRDHRDWRTLAEAARNSGLEVVVTGPSKLPPDIDLPLVRTSSPQEYHDLVERSAAVIVPLIDGDRPAGLLTFLDAFSFGRPVVATAGSGSMDYITPDRGILVPVGDPLALRAAMERVSDPAVSSRMGVAALAATRGELSLQRFIEAIDVLAREIHE